MAIVEETPSYDAPCALAIAPKSPGLYKVIYDCYRVILYTSELPKMAGKGPYR